MRSLILTIAAAVLFFQAATTFAAPVEKKVVDRAPVVTAQPTKVLGVGGRVQGTVSKVNPLTKSFEVQTAQGLVKVPVNAKLKMQFGENGPQVDTTFQAVQNVAARRIIVIIIRSGDTVIVIVIRTRRVA